LTARQVGLDEGGIGEEFELVTNESKEASPDVPDSGCESCQVSSFSEMSDSSFVQVELFVAPESPASSSKRESAARI